MSYVSRWRACQCNQHYHHDSNDFCAGPHGMLRKITTLSLPFPCASDNLLAARDKIVHAPTFCHDLIAKN